MIAYCISKLNYGEKIYQNELNNYIDNEMKTYEYELESMIQQRDSILNAPIISDYRVRECKKLYYEAKKSLLSTEKIPEEDLEITKGEEDKIILTFQDISCFGQCSSSVTERIISACGIKTAILPGALLSNPISK